MKSSIARFAGLLAIFVCGNAVATIVGTFDITGIMTVTSTGITWATDVPPNSADQASIGSGPTGIYSALGGTTATIDDLNSATEPVGVTFSAQSFISFDANPTLSSLLINFIADGVYSSAGCTASPPASGQTCTLFFGSPFNFVNAGFQPITSAMTWSASGVSADGLDTWVGTFTSQFGTPFQTVLAGLQNTGSLSTSYSATIAVQTAGSSVPEPSSVALIALALMAMLFFLRRRSML